VPAIVHLAHNSQELGNALADALFGDYNPAGRLVQTWPRSLDQLPPMMDYNIRHGRTYMYFKGEPLYPFGYGLSYTTFRYSNLKTSARFAGQGRLDRRQCGRAKFGQTRRRRGCATLRPAPEIRRSAPAAGTARIPARRLEGGGAEDGPNSSAREVAGLLGLRQTRLGD